VGEIFTNPGGALTLIENDVKTVISDIESVAEGFWNGLTCLFKNCATSTSVDPAATLSSSCNAILAAATTTYGAASTTSTYTPAQTIYVTTTAAPKTSTTYTGSASTTLAAQASSQSSASTAKVQPQAGSSGGKIEMSIPRAWFALSVCFLAAVFIL
jgi:septal ring-binding cell division protein DamX